MPVKKFLRTSPFLLLIVFALVVLLYELAFDWNSAEGWRYLWLKCLSLFLLFTVPVDLLLKHFLNKKYWLVWLVEMVLCLGLLYFWVIA